MTSMEGIFPVAFDDDWLMLEYPAIVQDEQAVFETIGGAEAVIQAENSGDHLVPMLFQPDNPLAHFLYAGRTAFNGLVLQITKKKEAQAEVMTEVIAKVSATYRFSGMCDFTFTPHGLPIEEQSKGSTETMESKELDNLLSEDPRFSQEPILNVPPLFSKLDCPVDSVLKEKSAATHIEKSYSQSARYAIPFSSPKIPAMKDVASGLREKFPESWSQLEALFKQRPIWSEQMLMVELPTELDKEALLNLLANKCYRFRDGPWQKLWIVKGFDPRLDKDTRQYQSFIYNLPTNWYVKSIRSGLLAKIRQKFGNITIHQLNKFHAAPLTKSTLFQCCDLEDAEIQNILRDTDHNCKEECSQTTGWFTNEAWSQLFSLLRDRFQTILDQACKTNQTENDISIKSEATEACPADQLLSFLTDLHEDTSGSEF